MYVALCVQYMERYGFRDSRTAQKVSTCVPEHSQLMHAAACQRQPSSPLRVRVGLAVHARAPCSCPPQSLAAGRDTLPTSQCRKPITLPQAFWAMHVIMLMLIIRTVFRLIEFNMGVTGYVSTHEW